MVVTADEARFEELFTAHYEALMRYAARRVGLDSAQEVVGDALLVAWRRLDEVPANALPWLYGVTRRTAANELRRRARLDRLGARVGMHGGAADHPDHADAVSEHLEVRAALARLHERDRSVLLLAEWEQLTTSEIAVVLGCSVAAAKVRLHRARRRLAALADPERVIPDTVTIASQGDIP